MAITVAQCEEFLRNEISWVKLKDMSARNNSLYYTRNILFYAWLLQMRHLAAELDILRKLVGLSSSQDLATLMESQTLSTYIEEINGTAVRLIPNMLKAVGNIFDHKDYNYKVLHRVPNFGDVTGSKLIEYLNN